MKSKKKRSYHHYLGILRHSCRHHSFHIGKVRLYGGSWATTALLHRRSCNRRYLVTDGNSYVQKRQLRSIKRERTADAVGTSATAVLFPYRLLFVFGFRKRIAAVFRLSKADNECENIGEKPKPESKTYPMPKGLCHTEIDTDRKIEHIYGNHQFAYWT